MRTSHSDENLEKIMLTRKEKHLLRRLIKLVSITFSGIFFSCLEIFPKNFQTQ